MQQLQQQQQLMIKKMQELQRQRQLQQFDLRELNLINDISPLAKQISGSQSTLVNGPSKADILQYPWATELGTNWLNGGSPNTQGSPNRHGFQPNVGQPQHFVDLAPQQVDQSLYGVPLSCSRGLPVDQFSQMVTARCSVPQMSIPSNYPQGNQHNSLQDQVHVQNEYPISWHKFQNENMFGLASALSQDTGMRNMGCSQQVNSMPGNALLQDFLVRQELAVQPKTSHEKPTMQVASPHKEVALDPTEEKILFGSDDNVWAAFGKVPGESSNSFNNGSLSNGLPSFQSGSWSALMQSAVAETSSSDIAPQEEWSGLIFPNNDGPSANLPPSLHNDCCKQESSLANGNMRIPAALSSESCPPYVDTRTTNGLGLNDLGRKFQNKHDQTLQTEMSESFFQMEGSDNGSTTCLRQNVAAGGSQLYGDSSLRPLQPDISAKTIFPTWIPGQTITGLQSNVAAMPLGGDRVTITDEAEKRQPNSSNSQVRVMQGEMAHGSSLWKSNAVPSSATELDHVNSRINNHPENTGILSLKDASVAKSSNAWSNDESRSFVQNNYLLNQWKNAYPPSRLQDGGSVGRPLHHANSTNQVLDSMNSHEKGEVPRNEINNCYGKENSDDSHRSNLSQHISGGFREDGFSDVSDSQSHPTGKQKSTNQFSMKVSAPPKFQHHPMGNVDEGMKPTYGQKQPIHVQAMSQQNAHCGQSKIFGQVPRDSIIMEKGQSAQFHKNAKGTDKESSHGNLSGHAPNTSFPFSRPIDAQTSNNASSSSQNMLELLHKVDHSRNHGAMMQFSSSECKSSSQQPEAEAFDGFGHLQHGQSSVSQGFGLQLGPPSQNLQTTDHPFSSQTGQGTFSSLHASSATAGMRHKGHQIVSSHSVQLLPSAEDIQVEFGRSRSTTPGFGLNESSLYKTPENFTSAFHFGTPHSKGNFQNQQITGATGQMSMKQHIEPFDANASYSGQKRPAEAILLDVSGSFQQDNITSGGMHRQSGQNDIQEKVPTASISGGDHEQTFQHFPMPRIGPQADSTQMLHNMWTHGPTLKHNKSVQFQQAPPHILESPQPNIVESSSTSLMQDHVNSHGVVNGERQRSEESCGQPVAAENNNLIPKMKNSLGIGSAVENHFDDSPANSASTQKDIEAFGRSLKPNSYSQNYLLHSQMNALKEGESDSNNRVLKWMRGPDNIADAKQSSLKTGLLNEHNSVAEDSMGSSSGIPIEDSKILGFSRPSDIFQRSISRQGDVSSHGSLGLTGDVSQSFPCNDYMNPLRVSPQMAPSWFSQYRVLTNGQMLQINDAYRVTPLKSGQSPFTSGKASSGMDILNQEEKGTSTAVDACQIDNSHQTSSLVANGHFSSPRSSQLNVTGPHLVILRPKKRKTSELHPWHKEISEGSQDLWSVSMAEADWNKAANCLTEKVEDDTEIIEDEPPVVRSKRRLILTTYLMQQLLRPAPADVLCIDASSSYEIMAYTASRIALGDACSMASHSSNFNAPCDGMNLLPMMGTSTERNGGGSYAQATEHLMGRARKLENDFLRLDKCASVLDLRVECQDLEKFSIINRFARFHGRAQTDTGAASTETSASTQKPIPLRYVSALPMPRSLPDGIQCLSL